MKKYTLIFLNTGVLILSSKEYRSWREIQNEYENFSTSIDFEDLETIKEYIMMDYKLEKTVVENLITTFIKSNLTAMPLDF